MKFGSKRNNGTYGVVFEVGSGSVGGAIISSSPLVAEPVILFTTREFIPFKQIGPTGNISKRLLTVFLALALEIDSQLTNFIPKNTKLDSLVVNFTAPWSHTRSNTYTYEADQPFVVTKNLMENIKTTATEKILKESTLTDTLKEKDLTIINRTITAYTANGYPVKKLIGKTVNSVSITETISAVGNDIFLQVKEILDKVFTGKDVKFLSSPLILQHLIRSKAETQTTFSTIHLTYEAIELTIFRNNEITTAFTVGIGINTIARNVAMASKLPHEQIFSFLTAEDTSTFKPDFYTKIQKTFAKTISPALNEFFTNIHAYELLPHDFYLIATIMPSQSLTDLIYQALKESNTKKFKLHNLKAPIIHTTATANIGSTDLGLCALTYFFHNTVENN